MTNRKRLATRIMVIAATAVLTPVALANAAVVHVSASGTDGARCGSAANPCKTLSQAVTNAASGDEIALGAGRFEVPQPIDVTKSVTIRGSGETQTFLDGGNAQYSTQGMLRFTTAGTRETVEDLALIRPGKYTGNGFLYGILVKGGPSSGPGAGVDITVRHTTFTGAGGERTFALWLYQNGGTATVDDFTTTNVKGNSILLERQAGAATVENSSFQNLAGAGFISTAISDLSYGGAVWNVTGVHTFKHNVVSGPVGVAFQTGVAGVAASSYTAGVSVTGNRFSSAADALAGVALTNLDAQASGAGGRIANARISGNDLAGSGSGDGVNMTGQVPGAQVSGNSIRGYRRGIALARFSTAFPHAPTNTLIHANQIVGNAASGLAVSGATGTDATGNWWGCNAGPAPASACDSIAQDAPGAVRAGTWIVLGVNVTPTILAADETATVEAGLDRDNTGHAVPGAFDAGTQNALTAAGGTLGAVTRSSTGAVASSVFTSAAATGRSVTATKDHAAVTVAWPDVTAGQSQSALARQRGRVVEADRLPSCARHVAITAVTTSGAGDEIGGLARSRYSGEPVFLTYAATGERVLATPTVGSDGTWHATIGRPAQPSGIPGNARYLASIGGQDSKSIKRTRRLVTSEARYSGGKLRVSGRISKPLHPGARLQVTHGDFCGRYSPVGSLRVDASGRFNGALAFHSRAREAFIRLKARVTASGGHGSFTTFSIATGVKLR